MIFSVNVQLKLEDFGKIRSEARFFSKIALFMVESFLPQIDPNIAKIFKKFLGNLLYNF